jgi:predicted DNA-binding protein YlxM (UPF0122 family)|tara:strand:+ start:11451 stop:11828 length:378 start_codon:yes stop_codon:yes gene_type:complete
MKGISDQRAQEMREKYRKMYALYSTGDFTLAAIGDKFGLTRQRTWQIITRCKLGEGNYYFGEQAARVTWRLLKKQFEDPEEAEEKFMDWLQENDVRVIRNNRRAAPHTGWKDDAQRVASLETTEG